MSEKAIANKEKKINLEVKKLIWKLRFARIIDYVWICDEKTPRIVDQLSKYSEEAAPALPILYKLSRKRTYYRLKEKAIRAIGKIRSSDSIDFLINILKKRTDQDARRHAIDALQNYGEEIKNYTPYFNEIVLNKKENSFVRHSALEILAALLDDPSELLISFISPEKDEDLELLAVKYLGRLRVNKSLPLLKEGFENADTDYEFITYALAIVRIERNFAGRELLVLEKANKMGLLDPFTHQREFLGLYYSIRDEFFSKLTLDEELIIDQLIDDWENQTVEFKTRLYYCTSKKDRKKKLFYEFVQSVAAFANTNTGLIIVGVDNKKKVEGIKDDLEYWSKLGEKNPKDKYRNEFTNQLENYLGTKNLDFIKHRFIDYKNEELFIAKITRSKNYIYVNKNDFYKRVNESDRKLVGKDLVDYTSSDTSSENEDEINVNILYLFQKQN